MAIAYSRLTSSRTLLLPLESHPNSLLTQRNPSRSLLRRNRPILILILHERNAFAPRHHTRILIAWKSSEHCREHLLGVVFGQLPQEQGLVRRKVFVWYVAGVVGGFVDFGGPFGEGVGCGTFGGFGVGRFEGLFAL